MRTQRAQPTEAARKNLAARVRSLAEMAAALRKGASFNITRLTVLKTLAREPRDAARFVLHLAVASRDQMVRGPRPREVPQNEWDHHKALAIEAVAALEEHLERPSARPTSRLRDLLARIERVQNTIRPVGWGEVREIIDLPLLVIEDAVRCMVLPQQAPEIAYQAARNFAQRYDPKYPAGLVPASAPFVEKIAEFWEQHVPSALPAPDKRPKAATRRRPPAAPRRETSAFATAYPAIARWVNDCGWIEVGYSHGSNSFVRALDVGGSIWEGKDTYPTVDAALAALENALAKWIARNLDAQAPMRRPGRKR